MFPIKISNEVNISQWQDNLSGDAGHVKPKLFLFLRKKSNFSKLKPIKKVIDNPH